MHPTQHAVAAQCMLRLIAIVLVIHIIFNIHATENTCVFEFYIHSCVFDRIFISLPTI